MTMSKELQGAFNDQIRLEFASAYVYLGMAAWCEAEGLAGFASWMRAQAGEETQHALKFFDFLLERDARVELLPVEAPQADYPSALGMMQAALDHERLVTKAIGRLYADAQQEEDYASLPLLGWFLREQVEEEAGVRQIVSELEMVGEDTSALLLLDREMAVRRGGGSAAPGA